MRMWGELGRYEDGPITLGRAFALGLELEEVKFRPAIATSAEWRDRLAFANYPS